MAEITYRACTLGLGAMVNGLGSQSNPDLGLQQAPGGARQPSRWNFTDRTTRSAYQPRTNQPLIPYVMFSPRLDLDTQRENRREEEHGEQVKLGEEEDRREFSFFH